MLVCVFVFPWSFLSSSNKAFIVPALTNNKTECLRLAKVQMIRRVHTCFAKGNDLHDFLFVYLTKKAFFSERGSSFNDGWMTCEFK